MTLLGIDYGVAKIGLALAEGHVAAPLRVVRFDERSELRSMLQHVMVEYDVRRMVVGMPRMHREPVEEFVEWLRREFTLAVYTEDEQLTTQFAKRLMRGWKGKAEDDAIAAALILQSYIERTTS